MEIELPLKTELKNAIYYNNRARIYLGGGVIGITSRILVVDMLNKMLPVEKLSGILVNNAHR